MTRAIIKVNGVDGSNDNLPINTLVNLSNDGNGGETTYLWSIVDKPAGSLSSLSSTTIQSPTITPDSEGTYELSLIVNQGLSDQASTTAIIAVRQLKSGLRIPAATETIEDGPLGWKPAVNAVLQQTDKSQADSNRIVCQSYAGAAQGDVVLMSGTFVLKSGLPGQETIPLIAKALATTGQAVGIIEAPVTGVSLSSTLVYVRFVGLVGFPLSGSPAVGALVYLNQTTSQPTLTYSPVTLGAVVQAGGGTYMFAIDGHAAAAQSSSFDSLQFWGGL